MPLAAEDETALPLPLQRLAAGRDDDTLYHATPVEPAAKPSAAHIDWIDGMRGLAALSVLIGHIISTYYDTRTIDHASAVGHVMLWIALIGRYAVDAFITISGFCLALPVIKKGWIRGSAVEFLERRVWRILPTYYAAFLFCWFIDSIAARLWFNGSCNVTPTIVFTHMAMMQDVTNNLPINPAFWSLAAEWHIYMLFPLIAWLFVARGMAFTFKVMLPIILAASLWVDTNGNWAEAPHYVLLFLLGMTAATMRNHPDRACYAKLAPLAWCVVLAASVTWAMDALLDHQPLGLEGALDLCVGAAVFGTMLQCYDSHSLADRFFANRLLVWIGSFSYSLYLVHSPLVHLFWVVVGRKLANPSPLYRTEITMLVVVIPILLFAWLFSLILERPFAKFSNYQTLKHRFISLVEHSTPVARNDS